jgi:hypothetical protein
MTRTLLPLLAMAACSPAVSPDSAEASPLPALAGKTILGGCRQGECGWLRIRTVEKVSAQPEGELRKMIVRRGTSHHPDGGIPEKASDARIEWDGADRPDYAFCSGSRPAYAFTDSDGTLVVHFLDLFGLGGYQMGSGSLYMRLCHGFDGLPDEKKLRALGYVAGTRSEQIEARDPEVMTRF